MKKTIYYYHEPVMKNKVIDFLKIKKDGIYLDATFGYGGHSQEILKQLGNHGRLYAIDKDPNSEIQSRKIIDTRFQFIFGNFSKIYNYCLKLGIIKRINGILFDLGVSSPQLNDPNRGFSFMKDGPLDMRMNPKNYIPASKWLIKAKEDSIASVLKKYGEEKYAKRIAYFIKKQNKKKIITRTTELSNLISKVIPIKKRNKHPATRSFQAIRIHINQEMKELELALKNVLDIMKPKGRILIISFHSLEDRKAKIFIDKHSSSNYIPKNFSITEKNIYLQTQIRLKNIGKVFPDQNEIQKNPRSRSAILRIAETIV